RTSMLWMVPFQMIVLGVVGVLFFSRTIRPGAHSDKKIDSIGKRAGDATTPEPTVHLPPQREAMTLQGVGSRAARLVTSGSDSSGEMTQEKGLQEVATMSECYIDFDLHVARGGAVTANSSEGQATAQISTKAANSVGLALSLIDQRQANAELLKQFGQELYD